jgi:hypothetical protein
MARTQRKRADELALRAAVAFAEGMDGVDLAQIVPGAQSEGIGVETLEVVFGLECGEDGLQRWNQELRGRKAEGVGARGSDLAEVAGPGEDVLKDIAVDRAKVRDVEFCRGEVWL